MLGLLLSLTLADPALTAPQDDLQLWRAAEEGLAGPERDYAVELAHRLHSHNAYDRLIALKRLRALPALVTETTAARLAELAREDTPLYDSRQCLEDRAKGVASDCPMTTVGDHARAVLVQIPAELAGRVMIERVLLDPKSAEALSTLVGRVFGERASAIVPELLRVKRVEQQAALLLLATELGCAGSAVDVASLKPFLSSRSELVRTRAALVLLKRSDGCEHAAVPAQSGAREQAVRIVAAAITRDAPLSVLEDLRHIGTTGSPLIATLIERLDHHDTRVLPVLGAMKFRARETAAKLAELLAANGELDAQKETLRALSLIRPRPDQVRDAILRSVQRSGELLHEGTRALADIEAPLSASEFEFLSRLYRAQCKDAGGSYSYRRNSECRATSSALSTLASRSGHDFEAR